MSGFHDDISGFGALSQPNGQTPPPTLISLHASHLAIDLIWDSSVAGAPNGFISAVDSAARLLVALLSPATQTVVYVDIGWGEFGGTLLQAGDLGESQANIIVNADYSTVVAALAAHGDNVSTAQADGPLGLAGIPVDFTTAEGKALGLLGEDYTGPSSPNGVDGAIGFSSTLAATGNSWNFDVTGTRPTQYNLQAVALHELTEVLGRLSSEGVAYPALMPLDLLTFSAPGALNLAPGGYFSADNGVTQMGQFNPYSAFGIGDVGDWASFPSVSDSQTLPPRQQDSFNAFLQPGYNLALSLDDLLEMDALGY